MFKLTLQFHNLSQLKELRLIFKDVANAKNQNSQA